VRGRPGSARTILLFHIISVRPSKQSRMVGSTRMSEDNDRCFSVVISGAFINFLLHNHFIT
jgi:hypothetical protein